MLTRRHVHAYNVNMFGSFRDGRYRMPCLFLATCVCVFVSGCGAARTPEANSNEADSRQDFETNKRESSRSATTTTAGLEPPESTLSDGEETVEAGIGAYCWSTGGASSCVDAIGISLGEGKLTARPGEPLSFAYRGGRLDSLGVTAYEVDPEDGGGNRIESGVLVPPYKGIGKKEQPEVRRSGDRARIDADLPAGEYVLDMRARMPEGDASYGFHVVVEAREAAGNGPRAFAAVRFGPAVPVDEARRIANEYEVRAGMIEGQYRIGDEVHTWGWTGGLGTNFEKQHLGAFADMVGSTEQMPPKERREVAPETPAMREALESGGVETRISSIEFYGPEPVLEALVREEEPLISSAKVTTGAEMREMLKNLPKGCCN